MANIINGKEVSAKVKAEVKAEAQILKEKGIEIGLAVVIVGINSFLIITCSRCPLIKENILAVQC